MNTQATLDARNAALAALDDLASEHGLGRASAALARLQEANGALAEAVAVMASETRQARQASERDRKLAALLAGRMPHELADRLAQAREAHPHGEWDRLARLVELIGEAWRREAELALEQGLARDAALAARAHLALPSASASAKDMLADELLALRARGADEDGAVVCLSLENAASADGVGLSFCTRTAGGRQVIRVVIELAAGRTWRWRTEHGQGELTDAGIEHAVRTVIWPAHTLLP